MIQCTLGVVQVEQLGEIAGCILFRINTVQNSTGSQCKPAETGAM